MSQDGLVNINDDDNDGLPDCTFENSKCQDRESYDVCVLELSELNDDGTPGQFLDNMACIINGVGDCCFVVCECVDANGESYAGTDENGNLFSPDTRNYMSYTEEICGDNFTNEQMDIVRFHYDDYEKYRYLDCNEPGEFMGNNWSKIVLCFGEDEEGGCSGNLWSSEGPVDDDSDGVINEWDLCLNTPIGSPTDSKGCVIIIDTGNLTTGGDDTGGTSLPGFTMPLAFSAMFVVAMLIRRKRLV